MKENPIDVSVILPAYNAENFINSAIKSIIEQSLGNWELIVVDDGSVDSTADQVEHFNDFRIKLIQQHNAGVSAARNRGLDIARGRYITFLDADDVLPSSALYDRVSYMDNHPEVGIASGCVEIWDATSERMLQMYNPSKEIVCFFDHIIALDPDVFFGICYMIRNKNLHKNRFIEGISHAEDLIFFSELAYDQNLIYGAVDAIVYRYRKQAVSAMSNLPGIEQGYFSFLNRVSTRKLGTARQRRFLKWKVSTILFKSWVREGKVMRGGKALVKALCS